MTKPMEMAPDWLQQLHEAEREFFEQQLGPDITEDAKSACPVLTGRLQRAIDHQTIADAGALPELQVGVFPDEDGELGYAGAVELGFLGPELVHEYVNPNFMGRGRAVVIHEHWRMGNSPEQPYLRPALYRERYQ